ncbi:LutC/YkgG family protein [Rhodoflexus caldus]|uniref:LutC/YkgG family protein n=1 Tax=Rhodoflexus caldus TaxID=2891236 RepID=UPI002029D63D|nr:LUD domain-containing protein [Rhodoflexus caldus]
MKSNREQIISAIRRNPPPAEANLPTVPLYATHTTEKELQSAFVEILGRIGATVIHTPTEEAIRQAIRTSYPEAVHICSAHPAIQGNIDPNTIGHPAELATVDVAIVQGLLGVAENGAIWLTETQMIHRALPFITQHLVIVLSDKHLVENMHAAYQQIAQISEGFGVFISGPSRTADIEQSLVIGAHGARSLLVCLTSD